MRRRTLLAAPAAALLAAPPPPAEPPRPLAVPLMDVNVIGARVLTGTDGVPTLYGVTSGKPAKLSAVDARTGQLRFSHPLAGASDSYTVVAAGDDLYTGSSSQGRLYRVRAGMVEDLGAPLPGQTFLWDLAVGPDGRIFGVTYPGARLFSYDPATGQVRDYGRVATDTGQGRTIDVWGGRLYVGTMAPAHVLQVDPDTGVIRELPLPPGVTPGSPDFSVFDINLVGDLLAVRIGADIKHAPVYVLDPATEQWTGITLDNVAGLEFPSPGSDGRTYVMRGNELTAWDAVTGATAGTGLVYPGRVWNYRGVGWVDLGDPEWPGATLTGWFWRGEMWRYNPQTGKHSVTAGSTLPGEPVEIISLATARDGAVLAGGYLAGFARVDADTGGADFHRFSQTETLFDDGTSVWVGAYPDARGYRYDPTQPWNSPEYSPGPAGTPENPVKVWDLAGLPDGQDRVFAMVRAGRLLVAATGPKGPTFGGALVIHDTETGEHRVLTDFAPDQAASSLAVIDQTLYVGTWIYGGTGAGAPPAAEGTVFAYDLRAGRIRWQGTPVPGAAAYAAMAVDRDGRLWVIGDSTLVELQPEDGEVRRRHRLGDPLPGSSTWPVRKAILRQDPKAPALYARSGGRLWRVGTRRPVVEDLGLPEYPLFTALPGGDIVLARTEQLFRWRPPAAS